MGAQNAPGRPGKERCWTSAAKSAVGSALSDSSRIWFTIADGVLTEIYYPHLDSACIRRMSFVVTDGAEFFCDEQQDTEHRIEWMESGVPAFRLTSRCERFCLEKEILADPSRDTLLLRVRFVALRGQLRDYRLHVLLEPHIGNLGKDNTASLGHYKSVPLLCAERGGQSLALACSTGWHHRSVGFAGVSDGWEDLRRHKQMTWEYSRAEHGTVTLAGEINVPENGVFNLVVGFAGSATAAGHHARAGLVRNFDAAFQDLARRWKEWHAELEELGPGSGGDGRLYRVSATVLHIHEAKDFPGAVIASLSIPWGYARSGNGGGGYHLVWTRDLVESIAGLLAAGAHEVSRRVLGYLAVTQEADGHWCQNMWVDGRPHWTGIQLDEAGFPVLLAERAWRDQAIDRGDLERLWPMIRNALSFIVRNGPATPQDRWETGGGYSPFTLAVEISSLISGAALAEEMGHPEMAEFLRDTADEWNANVERWTYVTGTKLAEEYGIDGYYVWLAGKGSEEEATFPWHVTGIRNPPPGATRWKRAEAISPDALALVRFGLRHPDDPRLLNTIKVIDATLRVETPYGPAWHRYTVDAYGESADGGPFTSAHGGFGRAWPLLTGERAHYELAAGRLDEARRLARTMEAFASDGGMIPEQVWDSDDIPDRRLFCGRPTGSATPLAWAHAEYIKLLRSLRDGEVYDRPPGTYRRYVEEQHDARHATWKFTARDTVLRRGMLLRIATDAPATVHWTSDGWKSTHDSKTSDSGLGIHFVDLPTERMESGEQVEFTFFWPDANRWENRNFAVSIT
ncbi:glycoside hydrolase family 15 protein [Verrucomicrobiota bacterium sgz303538]